MGKAGILCSILLSLARLITLPKELHNESRSKEELPRSSGCIQQLQCNTEKRFAATFLHFSPLLFLKAPEMLSMQMCISSDSLSISLPGLLVSKKGVVKVHCDCSSESGVSSKSFPLFQKLLRGKGGDTLLLFVNQ